LWAEIPIFNQYQQVGLLVFRTRPGWQCRTSSLAEIPCSETPLPSHGVFGKNSINPILLYPAAVIVDLRRRIAVPPNFRGAVVFLEGHWS
jgi:hypothetical protein